MFNVYSRSIMHTKTRVMLKFSMVLEVVEVGWC